MRIQAIVLLIATCSSVALAVGQDCSSLESEPASVSVQYLAHAGNDAAVRDCVLVAFRRIASSRPEKSIPMLIGLLGYKRPLNEGERHGMFMHGNTPEVLYPAVHELYLIGKTAQPKLIEFLANNSNATPIERSNALYTLLLIHQGDSLGLLRELKKSGQSLQHSDARDRLLAAAKALMQWCDERVQSECEDQLLW